MHAYLEWGECRAILPSGIEPFVSIPSSSSLTLCQCLFDPFPLVRIFPMLEILDYTIYLRFRPCILAFMSWSTLQDIVLNCILFMSIVVVTFTYLVHSLIVLGIANVRYIALSTLSLFIILIIGGCVHFCITYGSCWIKN